MTELTIFTTTGDIRFSTPINEGAKRVVKIMADDYVTLPFSTYALIDFQLGDWVHIPTEGRFCITEKVFPTIDETNGGYNYELKFDAQYKKWGSKIFKYRPQTGGQECSWSLTSSIDVHVEQVKVAVNALASQDSSYLYNGTDEWTISVDDSVDKVVAKPITFDNINILDGISAIAEAFECEWWVVDNVVHFGRCEYGDTEVELSRELNVTSISRSDTGEKTANRIYPYGSTDNLLSNYRRDLIFNITDIDSSKALIQDSTRPLSYDWFNEELWTQKAISKQEIPSSQIMFTKSGEISGYPSPQNVSNVLFHSKKIDLQYLAFGKNILDLSGLRLDVSATSNQNNAVVAILGEVTINWNYNDQDGKLVANGKETTGVVGSYIASVGNVYSFGVGNIEFDVEEFVKKNVNGTEMTYHVSVSDVSISINIYAQFQNAGTATLSVSTMNSQSLVLIDTNPAYAVDNIHVTFISGKLRGQTFEATLNPYYDNDSKKNNILIKEDVREKLTTGDMYEIVEIIRAFVPNSYFTDSVNEDDTINAIAEKRLMLPIDKGSYVDAYRYDNGEKIYIGEDGYDNATEMPLDEVIEDVVIFEDVRPDYEFEVTETWSTNEEVIDADGIKRIVFKFYLHDNLFTADNPFNKKYQLENSELYIRFSSGKLNGMQFGLSAYNEPNKPTRWEVIVDDSTNLPNQFYAPEVGNTFTITGLNVTIIGDQFVPLAEQDLYKKTVEYLQETNLDASAYDCIMKSEVMTDGLYLGLGQRVLLKENIFFKNGRSSRVVGYEYPLDYPYDNPKYTIGEKTSYSRLGDIESKLESLELSKAPIINGIVSGGSSTSSSSSVYVIGTNDTTPSSDRNVLSALRSIAEFVSRKKNEIINYLWRFAKGIEVGQYFEGVRGANINEDGGAEFDNIKSRTIIQSPQVTTTNFKQGSLAGVGGGYYTLNGLTYAEFDYLTARKGATFAKLIIQEYRSIGGALVVSRANGEIESIEQRYDATDGLDYLDIAIKDWDKNPQFVVGDLVRCQYWDSQQLVYVYYWVEVRKVLTNGISLLLGDFTELPQVDNKLVQMGNTTDEARQGCILITTENSLPRIEILDGINKPKIEDSNRKSICGSLDGFTDPYTGKKLSGYGLWSDKVYLNGEFHLSTYGKSLEDALSNQASGGRNLLVGTNKGSTGWAFSSNINNICTIKSIDHNGASGVQFLKSDATQIPTYETFRFPLRPQFVKEGKIYHLTFDAMQTANNNDVLTLNITLCKADGSNFLFNTQTHKMKSCDGKWHHFDIEFSAIASGSEDSGQYVYLAVRRGQSDNQYWSDIAFANLKLEEGFNSTDWTLAPEDVVSSFTEFKVTADGLTSRVTNSEGKISAIEQNAESISLKVGNLEKQTISTNNLLLKSNEIKENKDYLLGSYNFGSVAPQDGEEVTLSFSGYLGTGHTYFNIYNSGWSVLITRISSADYNQITKRFEKTFKWVKSSAENTLINIFQAGASGGRIDQGDNENPDRVASKVFNAMLTKSNKAVDWQPSSEDATKALLDTGIDIENKKVTLTADNFVIQNNEGKPTSSVDANGNWSTNALATKDDNDSLVITINKDNDRMQKFYYPNGKVRTEFGWDDVSQSLMRYYDELGNMLWKVGSASAFVAPSYKEWEEVLYYFSGYRELEYFDLVKSIAQSSSFPNDKKPSYRRTTPGSTKFYSEAQALQEYLLNGIYVGPSVLQYTEYDSFGSKVWEDWARDVYCFKDGDNVQEKYETIYWREYYGSNKDEEIE